MCVPLGQGFLIHQSNTADSVRSSSGDAFSYPAEEPSMRNAQATIATARVDRIIITPISIGLSSAERSGAALVSRQERARARGPPT